MPDSSPRRTFLFALAGGASALTLFGLPEDAGAGHRRKKKKPNTTSSSRSNGTSTNSASGNGLAARAGFGPGPRSGLPWHSGSGFGQRTEFEAWRGRPLDILTIWQPWQTWQEMIDFDRKGGFVRVYDKPWRLSMGIAMLPRTHDAGKNPEHWRSAARGEFDRYYREVAAKLRAYGVRGTVFRIGWEANGNSHAWQARTDPPNYIATFRRIADILRDAVPDCRIEWTMLKRGSQTGSVLDLYPGDDWVDIVGLDFYDHWPAINDEATWQQLYNSTFRGGPAGPGAWLDFARSRGKPLAFPEWAVCNNWPPPSTDNPFYIRKMFEFLSQNAADIAYETYFNQNLRHRLWPAGINPKAAAAYRSLWGA